MGYLELKKVEKKTAGSIFDRLWYVTFIQPCVDSEGKEFGYEVSLFSPEDENDALYGLAKSVFARNVDNVPYGSLVKLGFNRKRKVWFIKE